MVRISFVDSTPVCTRLAHAMLYLVQNLLYGNIGKQVRLFSIFIFSCIKSVSFRENLLQLLKLLQMLEIYFRWWLHISDLGLKYFRYKR